jgi:uncharacterized protein DUF5678
MAGQAQHTATLYLRGVPRALVREAKVAAARRGITLTTFVKEALHRTIEGELSGSEELPEDFRRDWTWYQRNKSKLLKRYANKYVAILNRKVVDHDTDFSALARRVFDRYGVRSIPMPRVVPEEEVVHISSPRLRP